MSHTEIKKYLYDNMPSEEKVVNFYINNLRLIQH